MPGDAKTRSNASRLGDPTAELERTRLQNDTLYRIIGVTAMSAELPYVLSGVVDLLTEATDCHACFVYVREGDRLRLRAASPVFAAAAVGVQFPIEKGLAGWSVRRNEPAFVRDNASEDPRFHYVRSLKRSGINQ